MVVGIRLQKDTKQKSLCVQQLVSDEYMVLFRPLQLFDVFWFLQRFLNFCLLCFDFSSIFFFFLNDDVSLILNIDFLSTAKYLVYFCFMTNINSTKITIFLIFLVYELGGSSTAVFFIIFFPSQETSFLICF